MKRTRSPYRYDVVGSFLRPDYLLTARARYEAGEIEREELVAVEDRAIIDLIQQQELAGLQAITDGEFRRASWHCDFFWGLQGVQEKIETQQATAFEGATYSLSAILTGQLGGANHPFIEHYRFTRKHASPAVEVKQTIPAPARFLQELLREGNIEATKEHYRNIDDLIADIAAAYAQVLHDLAAEGCVTVQFDDTSWARLIDGKDINGKPYSEAESETLKSLYLRVNNATIAQKPATIQITTHICRGNFRSTWFASGGYEPVATPVFDQENVSAYFLEYDSDRSGGFEPLAAVSPGKLVVLGLVTSKDGQLEDKEELKARIKEASRYVPLENLCISPQCGFSSNAEGNLITEADQWAKIALLREVAQEVWPEDFE